jgi:hypothetical protein
MLRLLAVGNGLKVVVDTISKEFGVPKSTVYTDHSRMADWVPVLHQNKQLVSLVRERLDLLNRELLGLMLEIEATGIKKASVKERFLKVNAAIAALKVVQEQIRLGQNLGLIERKPEVVISQNLSLNTPCEADPVLRQALEFEVEKQKAEKAAYEKAKAEKDAAAKSADAAGS